MTGGPNLLQPEWEVPSGVTAFCTTRQGGVSSPPYDSLNLGNHVGDNPAHVATNRQRLPLADTTSWLDQVHGTDCVAASPDVVSADACFTRERNRVCAVMTADCLPILLCDKEATLVAAVHAGWRGLASGIIENSINKLSCPPEHLIAWVGPAITQDCFEVQSTVTSEFADYPQAIKPSRNSGRFLLDMPAIAEKKLHQIGVKNIFLSGLCTYSHPELFFSHRWATHQNLKATGRIVSGIYLS